MTEPTAEWVGTDSQGDVLKGILTELGRIADGLDKLIPGNRCAERHESHECALRDRHVGHHVTADGRQYWLDDE